MIALVRGVIAASTRSGSMVQVRGSTSTMTGSVPAAIGAYAVAAYGGPVPLQALSLSHLRLSTFPYSGPNAKLMGPVAPNGKTLRVLSPVEGAILRDLGYGKEKG